MKHKRPTRKPRLIVDERWPQPVLCEVCDGDGTLPYDMSHKHSGAVVVCSWCDGRGTIEE